jgi:hypothetical protein
MAAISSASERLPVGKLDRRPDARLRGHILKQQQNEATRRQAAECVVARAQQQDALAKLCGLVLANTAERIAQLLDSITGHELANTTSTRAPDQLMAQAKERAPVPVADSVITDELLEANITADFVGTRHQDTGVAAARIRVDDDCDRLMGYRTGSMILPHLMLSNQNMRDNPQAAEPGNRFPMGVSRAR